MSRAPVKLGQKQSGGKPPHSIPDDMSEPFETQGRLS